MAPSSDKPTFESAQPEAPRLDLWLGNSLSLGDVADGLLHRLKHQNSALEKLRQALDENSADSSRPHQDAWF